MSIEEDPVAEFIARERNDFAGLDDDDNFGGLTSPPVVNGFSETVNGSGAGGFDENDLFGGPDIIPQVPDADLGDLRQSAEPSPPPASQPTAPPLQRVEPEKIRKWREDQKNRLEKKDAQEETEKQKWREQAKRELDDWYKTRVEQLEKAKINNKVVEQEFIRERDSDHPGQEWERITRLCEFNPKASKNAKDVSRMRSLLLQMKSQPIGKAGSATGGGGISVGGGGAKQ